MQCKTVLIINMNRPVRLEVGYVDLVRVGVLLLRVHQVSVSVGRACADVHPLGLGQPVLLVALQVELVPVGLPRRVHAAGGGGGRSRRLQRKTGGESVLDSPTDIKMAKE